MVLTGENGSGGDPGSSSYELNAISEEVGNASPAVRQHSYWDDPDEQDDPKELSEDHSTITKIGANPSRSPGTRIAIPQSEPSAAGRETDPWYSRVLIVWGVVFLIWAALILSLGLYRLLVPSENLPIGAEIVPTVVAVLLLVAGAAALFLLVDLGRHIRGLQASAENPEGLMPSRPNSTPRRVGARGLLAPPPSASTAGSDLIAAGQRSHPIRVPRRSPAWASRGIRGQPLAHSSCLVRPSI